MRCLKNLFGTPKTCVIAFSVVTLTIFVTLTCIYKNYISLGYIYKFYNNDIANTSGVLSGFIFAALGIVGATNNKVSKNLEVTGNITVVYKILINAIFFFMFTIIMYFIKNLVIPDINNMSYIEGFRYNCLYYFMLCGIYSFFNALVLFVFSLYILKKIIH